MTPSHDAPDTGPTSFDDGPAPATLGLSRREMRAAERARARELGIDEAGDAPVEETAPVEDGADAGRSEGQSATDAGSAPSEDRSGNPASPDDEGSEPTAEETPTPEAAPLTAPGVGPDTSAILLSGGVLTRRQLRAIREAEEAARQQRGSEHEDPQEPAASPEPTSAPAADDRAAAAAAVDDAPPASSDTSVPPYVRYGRGSRATPRPRAPYGSAYRRSVPADAPEQPETREDAQAEAETPAVAEDAPVTAAPAAAPQDSSARTPSAWPFAPIVPTGDAAGRDVDASGEQPTVPPLAAHVPSRDEDPRPAPVLEPTPWITGPSLEPAFGTRASAAAAEGLDVAGARDETAEPDAPAVSSPSAPEASTPDARAPFTPPTGHWSVQDQVDEDQPHTGNHFILPTVPHAGDMQQALNSTGEIIITGSIDLPRSLGSMGTHPDRFDTADMDRILEQGDDHDHAHAGSDSEPVRASRAVSTHTSTRAVVQPPPRKRFTAPVVAAVTAGGVAVIGAGLVIVAFMTNVF
ncbi:hypothetical protein [Clavibacter michiganensis]|uniref:Uncharacterized protein n=1 Tax=Clavibacter michiganensis TaxID=28447 RepID=A0A251YL27_9MICO|nr:hypothetical protein [Clavibacter michiganensis]OUE24927.1 hypothetical protein BFL37_09010 [Clavibacter michiganensis]